MFCFSCQVMRSIIMKKKKKVKRRNMQGIENLQDLLPDCQQRNIV